MGGNRWYVALLNNPKTGRDMLDKDLTNFLPH